MTSRALPDAERPDASVPFAVRLWRGEEPDAEVRGTVRDARSGAFAGFRGFAELEAFMLGRLAERLEGSRTSEGGTR